MPIYEFACLDCGNTTEILMRATETELVKCGGCGSKNLKKLLSAHASVNPFKKIPENSAVRCCGEEGPPATCAGPGSCGRDCEF